MQKPVTAKPEYVKAKTAVWWDINTCPIPHGYDARRIRPTIESALKNLGYSGPVEITVIGYLEDTPEDVLGVLSSTGISVKHGRAIGILFDLLTSWQERNPPPASMMLISDDVENISFTLCHRQQRISGYNLLRAFTCTPKYVSKLYSTSEWLWETLLATDNDDVANKEETRVQSSVIQKCTSTSLWPEEFLFYCSACRFSTERVEIFTTHLLGEKHEQEEIALKKSRLPDPWGYKTPERRETAKPEYVKAKMAVWWDINTCPIPHGYDARRIRPTIESALKNLGYSGPVEITVIGYLEDIPEDVLRGLSSTGISVKHGRAIGILLYLMMSWQERNPPPASMMLISDGVENISFTLCHRQQRISGYNILRAYTCIPKDVSKLYSTGEWLWETLLATDNDDDMANREETRVQSLWPKQFPFHCSACRFSTERVEIFTTHLSGEKHEQEEIALKKSRLPDPGGYKTPEVKENPPKSKRPKKRARRAKARRAA